MWALLNLKPGSLWSSQEAIDRLGEPEVSMSSTLGSQLIWTYYFPRVGAVVTVRNDDGQILAVTVRD